MKRTARGHHLCLQAHFFFLFLNITYVCVPCSGSYIHIVNSHISNISILNYSFISNNKVGCCYFKLIVSQSNFSGIRHLL